MSSTSPTFTKLMEYLRSLPAATRDFLISQLEAAARNGQEVPGADFILNALKTVAAETAMAAETVGKARQLFFAPVDPFVSEFADLRKTTGLISPGSVEAVWTWLTRDVAVEPCAAFDKRIRTALTQQDNATAKTQVAEFQSEMVKLIDGQLKQARDDLSRQRIIAQLGGDHHFQDLQDIATALRHRDALAAIARRLPVSVRNLADDALESSVGVLSSPAIKQADIFPFALVLMMGRLMQPHQIVRLAVRAADSDAPSRIAETPFALAVELMLGRMEVLIGTARDSLMREDTVGAIPRIKDVHDIARSLRTEIDLSGDSAWSRRMSALRGEMAGIIKPMLDGLPGHIRRVLRVAGAADKNPQPIDNDEVALIENQIDFLVACRNVAGELSLNEVTRRVFGEVQPYLESQPTALIEGLRGLQGSGAARIIGQIEASVRFCSRLFGPSYGQLLQKSADVVIQSERNRASAAAAGR